MTRVDEFTKKYPSLPRDFIVKWELKQLGIQDTEDLDKVSSWRSPEGSYQMKFDDYTLQELVERRPSRLKDGLILRPENFYMKSSVRAELWTSKKSPYQIKEISDGKVALCEGEEAVEKDLHFLPKFRTGEIPKTSKGIPISRLVSSARICFFFQPVHHCEYFNTGDQCRFCQYNTSEDDGRSLGLTRPVTEHPDDIVEAIKIRGSEVRLVEGRSDMGGFKDSENEGRIFLDLYGKITNALPYKPYLAVHTQAMSRKNMQRLKESGLDGYNLHMECWDRDIFPIVVPGKAKHASYDGWMEALDDALDIYGVGNVSIRTIGGLTCIPENGHQTWQEARDSHMAHNREMMKKGAFPVFGSLSLPPGSVFGSNPANRAKIPPTEYYLEVAIDHHAAMKEFGLYDTLNRFLWCGMDCGHSIYAGELGVLELAGNWGKWMSTVVPDKANWILKFLESIESPAKVE
ncbi:MAG: hypothetical protein Q7O66_23595 [Dehalococcoidia bacterium]|nr:hypothetical protein [Dehalococcoidia bacterium]